MYSLEDLSNIIFDIRECNANDNNMLLNMLEIIEDLYKQDTWVYYPANHDENGNNFLVGTDFPIGKCLIFLY